MAIVTLKELAKSLTILCSQHPELADKLVFVDVDGGYYQSPILSPVTLYKDCQISSQVCLKTTECPDIDDCDNITQYKVRR